VTKYSSTVVLSAKELRLSIPANADSFLFNACLRFNQESFFIIPVVRGVDIVVDASIVESFLSFLLCVPVVNGKD
jgi:hypothetical protein